MGTHKPTAAKSGNIPPLATTTTKQNDEHAGQGREQTPAEKGRKRIPGEEKLDDVTPMNESWVEDLKAIMEFNAEAHGECCLNSWHLRAANNKDNDSLTSSDWSVDLRPALRTETNATEHARMQAAYLEKVDGPAMDGANELDLKPQTSQGTLARRAQKREVRGRARKDPRGDHDDQRDEQARAHSRLALQLFAHVSPLGWGESK